MSRRKLPPLDPELFPPLADASGRRAVIKVHELLRGRILSGALAPDTILSQVGVARMLHVSRTPVREALRMLQESGLVSAQPNHRCRVLGFDPSDVVSLYMIRISLESLGVAITARTLDVASAAELQATVAALEGEEAHRSFPVWLSLHRQFHRQIVAGAGERYATELEALELRSERYQSAYKGQHLPGWWHRGELEHRGIMLAMLAFDVPRATELAARHLARTALELLAALSPEYDTSGLRSALQHSIAAGTAW